MNVVTEKQLKEIYDLNQYRSMQGIVTVLIAAAMALVNIMSFHIFPLIIVGPMAIFGFVMGVSASVIVERAKRVSNAIHKRDKIRLWRIEFHKFLDEEPDRERIIRAMIKLLKKQV